MLPKICIAFTGLIAAIQASILPRDFCFGGDPVYKVCFGSPNGGPENLDVEDIPKAAAYLRSYGRSTSPPGLLTIAAAGENNCTFVTLYTYGTVKVVAKHINFTHTTSVLFEDVADAIDGGEFPTTSSVEKAVISCGWKGGKIEVNATASRPEYHTQEFLDSGAITNGILVNLVSSRT